MLLVERCSVVMMGRQHIILDPQRTPTDRIDIQDSLTVKHFENHSKYQVQFEKPNPAFAFLTKRHLNIQVIKSFIIINSTQLNIIFIHLKMFFKNIIYCQIYLIFN